MTEESAVKVCVRFRPFIQREVSASENAEPVQVYWKADRHAIHQIDDGNGNLSKSFTFDRVFSAEESTSQLYQDIAKSLVVSAVEGYNGTIFAYGQTSSGKTFTMMGNNLTPGVIPLAMEDVFKTITNCPKKEFLLRVSYMEIYNETVTDLLCDSWKRKPLEVREGSYKNVYVADLTEELVTSPEQALAWIRKGEKNRHYGKTKMNERSSRSHTIFRMIIESRERSDTASGEISDGAIIVSHLNLVDLAGAERASQTGAEGTRFKEGCNINRSLFTLGQVIKKLTDENQKGFTNYRDSKLTRILQNSLGGNAKTVIICTVTPAAQDETLSTLQFASAAKRMKNDPHVTEVSDDGALLRRYRNEINELKQRLQEVSSVTKTTVTEKQTLCQLLQEKEQLQRDQEDRIRNLTKLLVTASNVVPVKKAPKRRMTWGGKLLRAALPTDMDAESDTVLMEPFVKQRCVDLSSISEQDDMDEFDGRWEIPLERTFDMDLNQSTVTKRHSSESAELSNLEEQMEKESQLRQEVQLQLEKEMQEKQELHFQLEKEMQEKQVLHIQLEKEAQEKQDLHTQLEKEVHEKEDLHIQLDKEAQEKQDLHTQLDKEVQEKQDLLSQLQKEVHEKQDLHIQLDKEAQEKQDLHTQLDKEVQEKQDLLSQLEKETQEKFDLHVQLETERMELQQQAELKSQQQQHNTSSEQLHTALGESIQFCETLAGEKKSLEAERDHLKENLQVYRDEVKRLKQEAKSLNEELVQKREDDEFQLLEEETKKEYEQELLAEIATWKKAAEDSNVQAQQLKAELETLSDLQGDKDLVQEVKRLRRSLEDAEGLSRDTKKEWAFLRSDNLALKERDGVLSAEHQHMQSELHSVQAQLEIEKNRFKKMQMDLQKELMGAFDENTKLTALLDGKVPKNLVDGVILERTVAELKKELDQHKHSEEELQSQLELLKQQESELQNQLQQKVNSLTQQVCELTEQLCEVQTNRDELLMTQQSSQEEQQQELQKAQEQQEELQEKLREAQGLLQETLRKAQEQQEEAVVKAQEQQQQYEETLQKNQEMSVQEFEATQKRLEKLEEELQKTKEHEELLQEELQKAQDQQELLQQELQSSQEKHQQELLKAHEHQQEEFQKTKQLLHEDFKKAQEEQEKLQLELQKALEQQEHLQHELNQAQERQQHQEAEFQRAQEQREQLLQELQKAQEQLLDNQTSLEPGVCSEELERLRSDLSALAAQKAEVEEILEGVREEKNQLKMDLEESVDMCVQAQSELLELQSRLPDSSSATNQQMITHVTEHSSETTAELDRLRSEVASLTAALKLKEGQNEEEHQTVQEQLQLELQKAEDNRQELLQAQEQQCHLKEKLQKTEELLQEAVQRAQEEQERLQQELQKAEERYETLQRQLSEIQEQQQQKEIQQQQLHNTQELSQQEDQQLLQGELQKTQEQLQHELQKAQEQHQHELQEAQQQQHRLEEELNSALEQQLSLETDLQKAQELQEQLQKELENTRQQHTQEVLKAQEQQKHLEEELRRNEDLLQEEVQRAQGQQEKLHEELQRAHEQLQQHDTPGTEDSGTSGELQRLQSELSSQSAERAELQEILQGLKEEKNQLKTQLEENMDMAQEQLHDLKEELQKTEERLQQAAQRAQEEQERLQQELQKAEERYETLQHQLSEIQEQQQQKEEELCRSQQQQEQLKQELQQASEKQEMLQQQLHNTQELPQQEDQQLLQGELQKTQEQLQHELQKAQEQHQHELQEAQQKQHRLEEELNSALEQQLSLEKDLQKAQEKQEQLQQELEEARQQHTQEVLKAQEQQKHFEEELRKNEDLLQQEVQRAQGQQENLHKELQRAHEQLQQHNTQDSGASGELQRLQSELSLQSAERAELQEILQGLKEEKNQLKTQLEENMDMAQEQQHEMEELKQEKNQMQTDLQKSTDKASELQAQLQCVTEEKQCLLEKMQCLLENNEAEQIFQKEVEQLRSELVSVTADREQLQDRLREGERRHSEEVQELTVEKEQLLQQHTAAAAESHEELESLRSNLSALTAQRAELQHRLQELQEERSRLNRELEDNTDLAKQKLNELEAVQLEKTKLQSDLQDSLDRVSELQAQLLCLTEKMQRLVGESTASQTLQEEVDKLQSELLSVTADREHLQEKLREGERRHSEVLDLCQEKEKLLQQHKEAAVESCEEVKRVTSHLSALTAQKAELQHLLQELKEEKSKLNRELEDNTDLVVKEKDSQQKLQVWSMRMQRLAEQRLTQLERWTAGLLASTEQTERKLANPLLPQMPHLEPGICNLAQSTLQLQNLLKDQLSSLQRLSVDYRKHYEALWKQEASALQQSGPMDQVENRTSLQPRPAQGALRCSLLERRERRLQEMAGVAQRLEDRVAEFEKLMDAELRHRMQGNNRLRELIASKPANPGALHVHFQQEINHRVSLARRMKPNCLVLLKEIKELETLSSSSKETLGEVQCSDEATPVKPLQPQNSQHALLQEDNLQLQSRLQEALSNTQVLKKKLKDLEEAHDVSSQQCSKQQLQLKELQDSLAHSQQCKIPPTAEEMKKMKDRVVNMELQNAKLNTNHQQELERMTSVLKHKEELIRKLKEDLRMKHQDVENSYLEDNHSTHGGQQQLQQRIAQLESSLSSQQEEAEKWRRRAYKLKDSRRHAGLHTPTKHARSPSPARHTPTKRALPPTTPTKPKLPTQPPQPSPSKRAALVGSPRRLNSPQRPTPLLDSPKSLFFDMPPGGQGPALARSRGFFDNSALGPVTGGASTAFKDLWPTSPKQGPQCETQ